MKVIKDNAVEIAKMCKIPLTCQVKDCNKPIFAIIIFGLNEKEKTPFTYPICREHCIEGSKLGTVIWDFKER